MTGKGIIEVEHPCESWARINTLGPTYFRASQESYCQWLEVNEELQACNNREIESELRHESTKLGISTILFSALCAEASINNYAGCQLGDPYFEKHLSSLDVVSKWVVIPKLVCNRSLDKGSSAFGALTRLVRERNSLTHSKSRDLDLDDPELHVKIQRAEDDFDSGVHNAYRALVLLSMEMDYVVGHMQNPLGTLDKRINVALELPGRVESIHAQCRQIVTKNRK